MNGLGWHPDKWGLLICLTPPIRPTKPAGLAPLSPPPRGLPCPQMICVYRQSPVHRTGMSVKFKAVIF